MPELYQTVTDEVILDAVTILRQSGHGALATLDPETGHPQCTRIVLGTLGSAQPVMLASALTAHFKALVMDPRCSLLVGEVSKGDPLINPRLTLHCTAARVGEGDASLADMREIWLDQNPKSKIYIDLPDFAFFRLVVTKATYIAGFGQAFQLPAELFSA
ncbi:MAG: pyridoxamine 5'-phosphate oxidase family protein [Hyphomicrobiaceae bacterium]|nr:pyridoxamine 5'-phosphate oxidase family protein [Hyphomicrobiaceae bacterium]